MLYAFYDSNYEKVFIIEVDYYADKKHINFIKFLVDKIENEAVNKGNLPSNKNFILLVHLQRNYNEGD